MVKSIAPLPVKERFWPPFKPDCDRLTVTSQRALTVFMMLAGVSAFLVAAINIPYRADYGLAVYTSFFLGSICFFAPVFINSDNNYARRARIIGYFILLVMCGISINSGALFTSTNILLLLCLTTFTLTLGWLDGFVAFIFSSIAYILSFLRVAPIDPQPEYASHLITFIVCAGFSCVGPGIFRREIGKAVTAATLSKKAAEQANEAKSNFLSAMSHEIRTPLNGVIAMAKLLSKLNLGPDGQRLNDILTSSANALMVQVNDILDLSKIESGRMDVKKIPFRVASLIDQSVGSIEAIAMEKGLLITCDIETGIPDVLLGDSSKIRQILINFLGNSVKFTDRGEVNIRVHSIGDKIYKFSISDTGQGISKQDIARIFNRFDQGNINTQVHRGSSGLGLALCKELSILLEAKIGVTSEVGSGSTFWLSLFLETASPDQHPITDRDFLSPGDLDQNKVLLVPEKNVISKTGKDQLDEKQAIKKLLMAEDNFINQLIMQKIISSKSCYSLTIVEDGQKAIDALLREEFDLVFLDVHMPVMSGDEALDKIRAMDSKLSKIPVVMVTASAMEDQRQKSMALGADAFVTKPINIDRLFKTLSHLLP